jgi:hypothetical protein
MGYKRIFKGKPFTFQEFVFFSPRQFDNNKEIDEKEFITKIKICTNSNRAFTGPFINETVGQYELNNKELNKILDLVYNTPGIIIYSFEYTINYDYNGLWRYYGSEKDRPLAIIKDELMAQ